MERKTDKGTDVVFKFLKKLGYNLCVSLHAIVLFILFPIFLLLFLPMWLTRQSVKLLAKVIRPDLCEMVTCGTSTCANANGTEDNPRMVTLVELLFRDQLDFEQVVREFNSRAVEKVDNEGSMVYPKLKQRLTSWLGIWFWTKDDTFDIKKHITCSTLNKDFVTEQDLRLVEEQLLSKPFTKRASPWEMLVVPNTRLSPDSSHRHHSCPDFSPAFLTTTIIFRISHILADGYSVKKLLEAVSTGKACPKLKINYPSKSLFQKFVFPFKFYFTMAEVQILSMMNFPFKTRDVEKSKVDSLQSSDVIPIETIRGIKERYGVSFTSVLISIATGTFRKLAIKNGTELTEWMPCAIPLPKPGHPDGLTNHFTLAVMPLPIGIENPVQRLRICHRELLNLRSSAYPASAACFMTVFGSFFNKVGEIIGINTFSAVNISYLPSGLENISFLGVDIIGQTFCMRVQKGSIGAVIAISSYKDRIQMHATVDTNVVPKEIMTDFETIIKQEVAGLKELNGHNYRDV